MKTLQIKTPQNINITFNIANVNQRLLAFLIDNILKVSYFYLAITYFLNINSIENALTSDSWSTKAFYVVIMLPITFYSLYTEILMNGQTIGKKVLKIKVTKIDGFKPSKTDFLMRWFLRVVDFNFFSLILVYAASLGFDNQYALLILLFLFGKLVGFLLIIFTKNNQRFGDIIANTVVIYLKDVVKFSDTILENLVENYVPTYPNVIKLSDNDARIIKDTFKVASKTNDYKTLIKLRTKILEVTGIISKDNNDKVFIDKVLKDYNFYTQKMLS